MARVTYAPVTGKTVNKTAGVSKPQPVTPKVATMKPTTSNPVGSMPYQPPGPATQPPSGGISHPPPVPPTRVPVNGGASGVSNSFNPSAPPVNNNPPPVKPPPMPYSGGTPPPDLPPVRMPPLPPKGDNVPPNMQWRNPNDAYTPLPNIGFGGSKPPFVPLPPEVVSPDIGRIPPAQGGIVSNPPPVAFPPPVPPPVAFPPPPGGLPPIPEPVGGGNNNHAVVGLPLGGAPAVVPPGGYAPIPEPTLPVGYNPGGGVGGIATQPIGNPVAQPGGNSAPFPETPIKTNADRAELAPPPGSYTKFADRGKWSGQDAQAQRIANKKNKKDQSDTEPDTGNLIMPPVKKKKQAGGGTTNPPKQGGGQGTPEASGTNKGNANKGKDKQGKNAKVTKADKQKAKNRKPQPGTPARPYRNRGVNYKPLGYGGSLRI